MDERTEHPSADSEPEPPDRAESQAGDETGGPVIDAGRHGHPTLASDDPTPEDRRAGMRELASILEALLFISPEPIGIERLTGAVDGASKTEVKKALACLRESLDSQGRGVQLVEVAGGFQLRTRPEYSAWIKRLERTKTAPKLSRSALESLAIIAYKQPLTRAEIEHIRGVETSGVIRTLLERRLARIVGRKEVPGRPILYGTTKQFLQQFGLNTLSDLPPLREFKELGQAEQALLPVGDEPLVIGEGIGEADTDDPPEETAWDNSLSPITSPVPFSSREPA